MEGVPHIGFELLLLLLLAAVVLANVALEFIARWRNPPIGEFLDIDGVRLHAAHLYLESRPPGRALCRGADAARHRAHVGARPLVGYARCAGDGRAQRRARERFSPGLRLLLPDLARRRLVREHRRHSADRRCLALHHFANFKLAWPSAVREENLFAPRPVPDVVKKEYPRLMLIRPSQLRAVAEDSAFMLPSAATLTMSYRRLKCPAAIIAGRGDKIVDSEQAVRLQKAMPHATVTLVPEAGHMVHYFLANQIVRIADVAQLEVAA
jgi:pimeloyl-ACP methyl ester carboxylesterase